MARTCRPLGLARFTKTAEDEARAVVKGHVINRATEWRRVGGSQHVYRCATCGWSFENSYHLSAVQVLAYHERTSPWTAAPTFAEEAR